MDIKKFAFEVSKTDGYAREGVIKTHRGDIHTPAGVCISPLCVLITPSLA